MSKAKLTSPIARDKAWDGPWVAAVVEITGEYMLAEATAEEVVVGVTVAEDGWEAMV